MTAPIYSHNGLEEFRVTADGAVESRTRASRRSPAWTDWGPRSMRSLLEFERTSDVWRRLKGLGVKRPAPSGKSGSSTPRAARGGVAVEVRLSIQAAHALKVISDQLGSKRAAIEAALFAYLDAQGKL